MILIPVSVDKILAKLNVKLRGSLNEKMEREKIPKSQSKSIDELKNVYLLSPL